jgi:GNAT superfamily N-acetyltransferase
VFGGPRGAPPVETSWRGASQLSSQPTLTARAAGRLCRAYGMMAIDRTASTRPAAGAWRCRRVLGLACAGSVPPKTAALARAGPMTAISQPRSASLTSTGASTPASIEHRPSCRPRRDAPSGRCLPRCDAAGRTCRVWHAEVQRRRADRAHAHVGRPSARGLGIGHHLLAELEVRAATNGSRTIHFKTTKTPDRSDCHVPASGLPRGRRLQRRALRHRWFEKDLDIASG